MLCHVSSATLVAGPVAPLKQVRQKNNTNSLKHNKCQQGQLSELIVSVRDSIGAQVKRFVSTMAIVLDARRF